MSHSVPLREGWLSDKSSNGAIEKIPTTLLSFSAPFVCRSLYRIGYNIIALSSR